MKASVTFTLVILLFTASTIPAFTSDQDKKLLEAAANGRTQEIGALLEEGADVDVRGSGSKTPLLLAAEKGTHGSRAETSGCRGQCKLAGPIG